VQFSQLILLGTHLFVKVPRPGDSEGTFSVFESETKRSLRFVSLSVILLQLKLTELKLKFLKSDFQHKKKDMNIDKRAK